MDTLVSDAHAAARLLCADPQPRWFRAGADANTNPGAGTDDEYDDACCEREFEHETEADQDQDSHADYARPGRRGGDDVGKCLRQADRACTRPGGWATLAAAPAPQDRRWLSLPRRQRLAALARRLERWQQARHGPPQFCPSGLPRLDAALGGGFLGGAVHELVSVDAAAATLSLALRVALAATGALRSREAQVDEPRAAAAARLDDSADKPLLGPGAAAAPPLARTPLRARDPRLARRWILYLDSTGDFYPPGAVWLGVPLEQLLIVRVSRAADALWVCEQALRCRSLAAVIAPLRRLEPEASRRLQLAAQAGAGLGLLPLASRPDGHTFCATRLQLEPAALLSPRPGTVGELDRRTLRITVLKLRTAQRPEPFVLELPDAADSRSIPAVPVDRSCPARRGVG